MAAEITNAGVSFRKLLSESSVVWAEQMIAKWDPHASRSPHARVASIFHESRDEARRFLSAVGDLRKAMQSSSGSLLLRRQLLLHTAMDRLKKELAEGLAKYSTSAPPSPAPISAGGSSTFRSYLHDYELEVVEGSCATAAVDYLQAIAECMITSGYAQECVEIYKLRRRAAVEEGMSRLGFEQVSSSRVQKLNWESLDFKIKRWLAAAPAVVGEIFAGERLLCDRVFACSEPTASSCFAEIARDAAALFFRFPLVMASKNRRPPEKIFCYLDMYRKIADLRPDIESVLFSSKSTNMVRSQVTASLEKLAETIKAMLVEFESTVHKDSSKAAPPDGGLHALTQTVANHVVLLADYEGILDELYASHPLPRHASLDIYTKPAAAERLRPIEEGRPDDIEPPSRARLAWLMTVLLCKIDVKSELYKEAWQSYLFLANNHQHAVNRVRESGKLSKILGEEWLSTHEKKARSFARSFLRLAWKGVVEAIPVGPSSLPVGGEGVEAARERMVRFNGAFEEARRRQAGWVVLDRRVRGEIRSAVARSVVAAYRPFYERCRAVLRAEEGVAVGVRFAPEDLMNHLSGLYCENPGSSDWESMPALGAAGFFCKGSRRRWLSESR